MSTEYALINEVQTCTVGVARGEKVFMTVFTLRETKKRSLAGSCVTFSVDGGLRRT